MDPYSPDGELALIHNAFHQSQYEKVLDWDTSSFSAESELPAKMLLLRSLLALGRYDEVLKQAKGSSPDVKAAALAAEFLKKPSESSPAVEKAKKLAESNGDNMNVEILVGIILARIGETEEAIALLSKHQGSLDAYVGLIERRM